MGTKHDSGTFFAESLTAHTNKIMVAKLPYETKRLTQEIGGGIVETGCMPSYKDFNGAEYSDMVQKYYKAGPCSPEARVAEPRRGLEPVGLRAERLCPAGGPEAGRNTTPHGRRR